MSESYANVAQIPTVEVVQEIKDVLLMKFDNGKVVYTLNKSKEYKEEEKKTMEKNSLHVQMCKAIAEIEARRIEYRKRDLVNYGYDYYTKEFYYCPENSEDEDEA